jgi:hypothetical protein
MNWEKEKGRNNWNTDILLPIFNLLCFLSPLKFSLTNFAEIYLRMFFGSGLSILGIVERVARIR